MKRYLSYLVRTFAEQKRSLKIVGALFLVGLVIGSLGMEGISRAMQEAIQNLVGRFKDLHGFELFIGIFLHNFAAAAVATASGIIFGLFPLLSALLNGLIIGTVLTHLSQYTQWTMWQALLGVLPHGIFEIPAFFLSLSWGVTLGTWPLKEEKLAFLMGTFNQISSAFFRVIIPFLGVAAAIETLGIEMMR